MRLLHTADWQLGLKALQAGDRAAEVREMRFAAAERVVELAHRGFVLLVELEVGKSPVVELRRLGESVWR